MAVVAVQGEWCTVTVDGNILGYFGAVLDANRFALGMLHDGLVSSVGLHSGLKIM